MFGGVPVWLQAGIWGLLGAASLIVGAGAASIKWLNTRVIAGIMGFGCGVLISAVAYDLIFDGFKKAGIRPIVIGAIAGSLAYAAANWLLSSHGAHHRKRSTDQQKPASEGGGLIIAIGSL